MRSTQHNVQREPLAAARAALVSMSVALIFGAVALCPAPAVAQSQGQAAAQRPATPQPPPAPRPAARPARPTFPRAFVAVNGAYQVSTYSFDESVTFRENAEDGHFDTSYTVDRRPGVALGGGWMLTPRVGVGAAVTRFTRGTPGTLTGEVPHPFFFARPRTVSGEIGNLDRDEVALHVQLRATLPVTRRIELAVSGGPSLFRISQGLVSDFAYADSYPYDVASFSSAQVVTVTKSAVGFNAGADVAYFFTRRVGVGFSATFARASLELPVKDARRVTVESGGVGTAAGLRFRF